MSKHLVSKTWRTATLFFILLSCLCAFSVFLNRSKFKPMPYPGHKVTWSKLVETHNDRRFLIVMISDTPPNRTHTASIKKSNGSLEVFFRLENTLFPKLPIGNSKNTFGDFGDWDHFFAFEIDDSTTEVVDKRTNEILWRKE